MITEIERKLQQRIDHRSNYIVVLEKYCKDTENFWLADNQDQLAVAREVQVFEKRTLAELIRLRRKLNDYAWVEQM